MSETATWREDVNKTLYFLKGYASAKNHYNMLKALIVAKELHKGQYRKGGAEAIVHPLRVCAYLVAFERFDDDVLFSAALLHDVVEDVECVKNDPQILVREYGLSQEVLDLVLKVTKYKGIPTEVYYRGIREDWRAVMIKLSDRSNNVSTLDSFSVEKMRSYILETTDYVLPLTSHAKLHYPMFNNEVTIMKYHITGICASLDRILDDLAPIDDKK